MWFENITRDLGDFTSSLVEDTKSLANIVTRLAAEVAGGESGFRRHMAGDEDSLLAEECPLDEAAISALQQDDAVYLAGPRDEAERALFEEWSRRSVYSSANIHQQDQSEMSGTSSDETTLIYRQRLLDENPVIAEKFMAFVQQDDQPRATQETGTEEQEDDKTSEKVPDEGRRSNSNNNNNNNDDNSDQGRNTPVKNTEPLPHSKRITEDEFFDRYFFRLSQLRLDTNRERRKREEEAAAARKARHDAATTPKSSSVGEPAKKRKSFTERLIEATDELVAWDDDDEDVGSNSDGARVVSGGNNTGRAEIEWWEQEEKIAALESLVGVLQEELSQARRRVTAVLTAARQCGISAECMQRLEAAASEEPQTLSPVKEGNGGKSTKAGAPGLPSESVAESPPKEGEAMKSTIAPAAKNNDDNNGSENAKRGVDGPLPEERLQPLHMSTEQASVSSSDSSYLEKDGWTKV